MGQLPEQVRKQSERADEYYAQLNEPKESTETQESAAPDAPQTQDEGTKETAASTQPTEHNAEQQTSESAPDDTAPKPENWEHKYRTLQGLFNAESRAWQTERKSFESRIQALEHVPKQPTAEPAQTKSTRVTSQDVDTYGPELLDVIGRKAAEMADQIVALRLAEIQPAIDETRERVSSVAGQVYKSAQDRFYGELATAVPDWQSVNADSRWLEWLGEVDPLSGVARQVYLDNASQQLDHERAARLFQTFKEQAGMNKPPAAPAPARPSLSPSPRSVGSATAPTPREPDTSVSRSDVAAHFRRASTDQSYRTGKDYEAMEQRIATAMATGNIVEA